MDSCNWRGFLWLQTCFRLTLSALNAASVQLVCPERLGCLPGAFKLFAGSVQVERWAESSVAPGGGAACGLLEMLGVDAADGHRHAAHVHHEAAVAVDAYDVALQACQLAAGDAQQGVVAGVVADGLLQQAQALRLRGVELHEGAHLGVGNARREPRGAVAAEVEGGEAAVEIGLQLQRAALDEDEAADGGHRLVAHALDAILAEVAHALVDEESDAVGCQLLFYASHRAAVCEEV